MLVAAAFLTAFYMFRVVFIAFWGERRGGHGAHGVDHHLHAVPPAMTIPLWILAVISVGIGIFFLRHHAEPEFTAPAWLTPLAVGVAVAGILLAWLTYQARVISADLLARVFAPIRRAALARFWLDDLFAGLYRHALLAFSRLIGWTDRYVVDGIVNVLSAWTLTWGDRLRRIQSGLPQDYVYGVAVGLLLLLIWVQWPR
jgi:NADH-quinone oxidoreductase subunit L